MIVQLEQILFHFERINIATRVTRQKNRCECTWNSCIFVRTLGAIDKMHCVELCRNAYRLGLRRRFSTPNMICPCQSQIDMQPNSHTHQSTPYHRPALKIS